MSWLYIGWFDQFSHDNFWRTVPVANPVFACGKNLSICFVCGYPCNLAATCSNCWTTACLVCGYPWGLAAIWLSVAVLLQFWMFALHMPFCILLIVFSVLFGRNCKCLLVLNVRRRQTQRNNQLVLVVLQLEKKNYCKTGGTESGALLSCHLMFLEYRLDGNTMFLKHATCFQNFK